MVYNKAKSRKAKKKGKNTMAKFKKKRPPKRRGYDGAPSRLDALFLATVQSVTPFTASTKKEDGKK